MFLCFVKLRSCTVLFISGFWTLLMWIFWFGSAKVLHQGTTIGDIVSQTCHLSNPLYTIQYDMCGVLCVLCFAVGMFCVFVLVCWTSLSQDRLTDWVYSSVSTGCFGNRYCCWGILSQSRMSLLLRNLCGTWPKDPHQQSSSPEKWKSTWYQLLKHKNILKNSSWVQSYDGLKTLDFLTHTCSEQKAGNSCWPKIWQWCFQARMSTPGTVYTEPERRLLRCFCSSNCPRPLCSDVISSYPPTVSDNTRFWNSREQCSVQKRSNKSALKYFEVVLYFPIPFGDSTVVFQRSKLATRISLSLIPWLHTRGKIHAVARRLRALKQIDLIHCGELWRAQLWNFHCIWMKSDARIEW